MTMPTSERHQVAMVAAETASEVARVNAQLGGGNVTPAGAAASAVSAYRAAIAELAKPIEIESKE